MMSKTKNPSTGGGTQKWLSIFSIAIATLFVSWVLYHLTKILFVPVVAGIVGASIVLWISRRSASSRTAEQAAPSFDSPRESLKALLDNLVILNLRIRENDLPQEVILRVERIIDKLRELLPKLNGEYASMELTWVANRMASDYLLRVVNPYLALSCAERGAQEATLLTSLEGLESELDTTIGIVRDQNVTEFSSKAQFLRVKFGLA